MPFSNKTYDFLKWMAQDVLPALGTLCFAVISLWKLPFGNEIVGTITAIDAFLGLILRLSSIKYDGDGTLIVDMSENEESNYRLELNTRPEDMANKSTITLKVNSPAHMKEK